MKKPKISDLKVNIAKTRKLRAQVKSNKAIKITINIDAKSLSALKKLAGSTGTPYQRLLNQILRSGLRKHSFNESRLNKLEQEIKMLKRKVA
jgi:predicted DNA binding CopG/RHH family protein